MDMLRFALPALGISLASPLMSNIDNAFVGRLSGTTALAALSPGTVLSDYILYLFIFIPRSTVGLVARARSKGIAAARKELSRVLSAAFFVGLAITALYLTAMPLLLGMLGIAPHLRPAAGSYAKIRGLVASAALMQSVALSGLLAFRDSMTPLKVVAVAAVLNFAGDWLFCAWPWRLGAAGAAVATALSTLAGFALMLQALSRKGLFPRLHWLSWSDLKPLLEYARPLSVVILTRFVGLTCMALVAARHGMVPQAAYQVLVNLLVLFGLAGDPVGQTAQSMLPQVLEDSSPGSAGRARQALKNLFVMDAVVSLVVGLLSTLVLRFGSGAFTDDASVAAAIRGGVPMLPICIMSLIVSMAVDGTLVAAREFGFVIRLSLLTIVLQLALLLCTAHFHLGLPFIFLSISLRYWTFVALTLLRVLRGRGALGRAVRSA